MITVRYLSYYTTTKTALTGSFNIIYSNNESRNRPLYLASLLKLVRLLVHSQARSIEHQLLCLVASCIWWAKQANKLPIRCKSVLLLHTLTNTSFGRKPIVSVPTTVVMLLLNTKGLVACKIQRSGRHY